MNDASATLRVERAGPLVTVQDGGRFGQLRFGVPASGPMDRLAHAAANVAIGNDPAAPAIEVSRAGVALDCVAGSVSIAVTGGGFVVEHGGARHEGWVVVSATAGDRVVVRPGRWGSWATVAVAGRLDAREWLGAAATHSQSGLGGGALTTGQELHVTDARLDAERDGEIPLPDFVRSHGRARVVMGPQDHHFDDDAVRSFLDVPYRLTDAFDRMGVRLDGPPLGLRDALSIPSEPIVRGSVQVAGDGVPTVLLADHQTTGGYPKIATVVSADVDGVAQLRSGDAVHFDAIDAATAVEVARRRAEDVDAYLARIAGPGRTITHRLRAENLIGGAIADDVDDVVDDVGGVGDSMR